MSNAERSGMNYEEVAMESHNKWFGDIVMRHRRIIRGLVGVTIAASLALGGAGGFVAYKFRIELEDGKIRPCSEGVSFDPECGVRQFLKRHGVNIERTRK